jgi:hypothetical protein
MKKHILIAATAALLALPNLSVLAASSEAIDDAGGTIQSFRQKTSPLSQMRASLR